MADGGGGSSSRDVEVIREGAARLIARLGLSGYDNASILKADEWVDSPEFRAAWEQRDAALVYDLGAYLGEAVIRRHGGKWVFSQPGEPAVQIKRNGLHIIHPFTKVQKRAVNGSVDQLLALVNLVEHVAARPKLEDVQAEAHAALRPSSTQGDGSVSGTRFMAYGCVAFAVVPLVCVVAIFLLSNDGTYALIGGGAGMVLGFLGLLAVMRPRGPKMPAFPLGTLAWEAQLTLPLIEQKLAEKTAELGPHPSEKALAEVRFYTAQLVEVQGILARSDTSPGRGYVGFDTFDGGGNSWRRGGAGQPG